MIPKWDKNSVHFIYMDTDIVIPLIHTVDVYKDISDDVEWCWLDKSNYDERKRKKLIGFIKD